MNTKDMTTKLDVVKDGIGTGARRLRRPVYQDFYHPVIMPVLSHPVIQVAINHISSLCYSAKA